MSLLRKKMANRREEESGDGTLNDAALDLMEQMIGKSVRKPETAVTTLTSAGIVPSGDGGLVFKDFKMTRVGLLSGETVQYEDWESLGRILRDLHGSIQWIVGDWFLCAESVWGKTYDEIAAFLEVSVETLYDYSYVSRSVQFSVRTEKLSFGHHKLVAGLTEDEQREWLNYAAENNLSVATMRKAIADWRAGGPTLKEEHPPYVKHYQIFANKHLQIAKKAQAHEREQMASQLEALAEQIRSL